MSTNKELVIILGPTGVGKTDASIDIAKHFSAEIFSCDSRQIYKELGIGVAKPNQQQLNSVNHHFIDHVSIHEHFSVSQYENQAIEMLDKYFKTNDIAIMCGGTGLYVDAILNGIDIMPDHDEQIRQEVIQFYEDNGIDALRFELKRVDPDYYKIVDLKNTQRILRAIEIFRATGKPFSQFRTNTKAVRNFNISIVGFNIDRDLLYERINKRVDIMFENNLLQEARDLYQHKGIVALKTIGYRELFDYFEETIDLEKAKELIKRNSRHYARRQLTWFRRYKDIAWFDPSNINDVIEYIMKIKSKII